MRLRESLTVTILTTCLASGVAVGGQPSEHVSLGEPRLAEYVPIDMDALIGTSDRWIQCSYESKEASFETSYDGISCCEPCCGEAHRPWIELSGGYLCMAREFSHNTPLVRSAVTGNPVVTMGDFEGHYESGYELRLRHSSTELRFFQLSNGGGATAPASVANQVTYQGDDYFSTLVLDYETDLYNVEINQMLSDDPSSPIQFSAGLRYMRLNEDITASFPGFTGEIYTQTRNDLFGVQLGADIDVLRSLDLPFSLICFGKAGVFYSDNRLASFPNAAGAVTLGRTSDSTSQAAFVGELGLKTQANVTDWLTLDAGYQLLFVDGVALAGEQPRGIDMQPLQPATSNISTGDVLYHGLTVSATIKF